MAELLIRLTDRAPDLVAGNLIDCRDDGFTWGRLEDPDVWASGSAASWPNLGRFAVVQVPSAVASDVRARAGDSLLDWRLDLSRCSERALAAMQLDGRTALADLSAIVSKATGEPI